MTNVVTCMILTGKAQEAAEFYTGLFGVETVNNIPDGQGGVLLSQFSLLGQDVCIINGSGPESDQTSQRVSFQIHVDGQEEFDKFWFPLIEGGEPSTNGWLKDRYGVWWNIVPVQQMQIFATAAPEKRPAIGMAVASMQRIDLAELERIAAS